MAATIPAPRVLVIGLDPYRVPGPWDPRPVAEGIEIGRARFARHGLAAEFCLFGLDGSDDLLKVVTAALCAQPWECIVIGGGLRGEPELLEQVVSLVRRRAPQAPIAFNATPADTFEAAARWVGLHDPGAQRHVDSRPDALQPPLLSVLCGLPGSGKTTVARELETRTGAIRFSTDEWMADLGVDYFDSMRERLQPRLDRLWRRLLERRLSVILEDGTWKREERDGLRHVAKMLDATIEMHYFDIGFDELWRRIEARNTHGAYGAVPITKALLEECLTRFERPDQAELSLFDRCIVHT